MLHQLQYPTNPNKHHTYAPLQIPQSSFYPLESGKLLSVGPQEVCTYGRVLECSLILCRRKGNVGVRGCCGGGILVSS
jgi:hypothetical protein